MSMGLPAGEAHPIFKRTKFYDEADDVKALEMPTGDGEIELAPPRHDDADDDANEEYDSGSSDSDRYLTLLHILSHARYASSGCPYVTLCTRIDT
jgi:hypothetical protein